MEELAPLAAEVAANTDLLKRLEDVAFGDDVVPPMQSLKRLTPTFARSIRL
jgi:hypothetical protein